MIYARILGDGGSNLLIIFSGKKAQKYKSEWGQYAEEAGLTIKKKKPNTAEEVASVMLQFLARENFTPSSAGFFYKKSFL